MNPAQERPEYRDETVIESSIVEVRIPPPPPAPPRKRWPWALAGLSLAALLLGAALYLRQARARQAAELDFLKRAVALKDEAYEPATLQGLIAEGEALEAEHGGATRALSSYLEVLRAWASTQEALAEAERARAASLSLLPSHTALAQRQAWVQEASPSLAHEILCEWEALRRQPRRSPPQRFALLERLERAEGAEVSMRPLNLLVQAALQLGEDPGALERSKALHALDRLGQAPTPEGEGTLGSRESVLARLIASAWRAELLGDPRLARELLEPGAPFASVDPVLSAWAHRLLGRLRWQLGELAGARAELGAAMRLDPISADGLSWRSFLAAEEPPLPEARAWTAEADVELPTSAPVAAAQVALAAEEDPERAVGLAQAACERSPHSPLLALSLGRSLARRRDYGPAQRALSSALEEGPSLVVSRLSAELLLELGQVEAAQKELARGLRLVPEDPELLGLQGWAALLGGDRELAARRARELQARAPGSLAARRLAERVAAAGR